MAGGLPEIADVAISAAYTGKCGLPGLGAGGSIYILSVNMPFSVGVIALIAYATVDASISGVTHCGTSRLSGFLPETVLPPFPYLGTEK